MIKLKDLLLESFLADAVSPEDRANNIFMSGIYKGVQDKKNGTKTKLGGLPHDFIRGYKSVGVPGFWEKANSWLTNMVGRMGSSLDKRTWREGKEKN